VKVLVAPGVLLLILLSACAFNPLAAAYSPPSTLPPPSIAGLAPTIAPSAPVVTATIQRVTPVAIPPTTIPERSPTPTAQPCADQACIRAAEHFWLERPVPIAPEYQYWIDQTYPYGSTQDGQREPHHGGEFVNPAGTPILAAADGTVVVSGDDGNTLYGLMPNFYGNLVVVQLDQTYRGQPVFTLNGHMSRIDVVVGQRVKAGDRLGAVGQTGIAIGPHTHFEVRIGRNDYYATRNPELWLNPLRYNGKPWGALAGRVVDAAGNPLPELAVVIRSAEIDFDRPIVRYLKTYAAETLNGDDVLQENFALTDLPLGTYIVSVKTTRLYRQTITIESGRLAWVTFTVELPLLTPIAAP
jgi:hypothetical protein